MMDLCILLRIEIETGHWLLELAFIKIGGLKNTIIHFELECEFNIAYNQEKIQSNIQFICLKSSLLMFIDKCNCYRHGYKNGLSCAISVFSGF